LHGIPGIISGVISAIVAASASRNNFSGNRLYAFYPSRTPVVNSTLYTEFSLAESEFAAGGLGRSAVQQGGYQIAALAMTIGFALVGGVIAGYVMKIPIVEQIDQEEEILDDEAQWKTPEDYSLKLTEVRVNNEEELQEKRLLTSSS
jgi:ammonium transporter Rh